MDKILISIRFSIIGSVKMLKLGFSLLEYVGAEF